MTQNQSAEPDNSPRKPAGATGMKLIVPLQGVVQGRGGLILGSLIPCALFYFFQLYLKRHRSPNSSSNPPSPSALSPNLAEIPRTSLRSNLSTRGLIGPVRISTLGSSIAKPNDSPYYIGLDKVSDNLYDMMDNPNGVIQLGLSENRLCFDLIEKWMAENAAHGIFGNDGDDLNINGIVTYQPFDGLME